MIPSEFLDQFSNELKGFLSEHYHSDSKTHDAIKYAMSAPGKRVRPYLLSLAGQLFDQSPEMKAHLLQAGIAIELMHTYSLVHDDLPCMDNDDLRRGIPTCHKRYGETFALLAGDGMLTDSFRVLASIALPSDRVVLAIQFLAQSSGTTGMVEGQSLDLETGYGIREPKLEGLQLIHSLKTGQLIGASCAIGAILAGASKEDQVNLFQFGLLLGHAFQVVDDILDNYEGTGKSKGKDMDQNKLTYLRFLNEPEARLFARRLTDDAMLKLKNIQNKATLESFAKNLIARKF